ncbi:lysylphosphatidylglycerol synthase domain-containing protein [Thiohalorhabdus sp.]|uniref:lysylphosphatidylglycerol synthase domain-containing protein n=1 Tax=Thiohalorhabdus sp. TaxID=3094134 RepID=UPI002FC394CE
MDRHPQWPRWLRTLLQPSVLLPTLLAGALLAFVLSISDLPQVFGRIREISAVAVLLCAGCAVYYLVLKGLVFRLLLHGLGFPVPWRPFLLAYAVGEMTLQLPAGTYASNYLLSRMGQAQPGRSSAATTVLLILETVVVMAVLAALGIPGWQWLQPALVVLIGLHLGVMALVVTSVALRRRLDGFRGRFLGPIAHGLLDLVNGLRALSTVRYLGLGTLLTLVYLTGLGVGLAIIGRSQGLDLSFQQGLTIYFAGLLVTLFLGSVLTQMGLIEAVGLGAAQAWGYGINEGLAAVLGFRLVWIGSVWLICGTLAFLLRGELKGSVGDGVQEPPN